MLITEVEKALSGLDLKFDRESEDQIVLGFSHNDTVGFSIDLFLRGSRLTLRAYTTGDIGSDVDVLRKFTTWWNANCCAPKAVQCNEDFIMDSEVTAWMASDLFFTEMLPPEYLQRWLELQFRACAEFMGNLDLAMTLAFDTTSGDS